MVKQPVTPEPSVHRAPVALKPSWPTSTDTDSTVDSEPSAYANGYPDLDANKHHSVSDMVPCLHALHFLDAWLMYDILLLLGASTGADMLECIMQSAGI